ncbi:MAG: hypothetical protein LBI19_03535, partial [Oscillospiraceae bacterium]|nr:hypothetical protein [Oscillospiraceae bacterium]
MSLFVKLPARPAKIEKNAKNLSNEQDSPYESKIVHTQLRKNVIEWGSGAQRNPNNCEMEETPMKTLKRTLAMSIAAIMLVCLLPLTAIAASPDFTLNKNSYAEGETIIANVTGIPPYGNTFFFLALYRTGAGAQEFIAEANSYQLNEDTNTYNFTSPHGGNLEVRLYEMYRDSDNDKLLKKISISIGGQTSTLDMTPAERLAVA